jgi:predicted transcriptional regulator
MESTPDLQFEVLSALWDLGRATVRDVHARVGLARGLAYTTTATVMDRLYAKGVVTRSLQGRTLVYVPVGERLAFERSRAAAALARLLGPSPETSVAALVGALADIDPALLDELERAVAGHRGGQRGS